MPHLIEPPFGARDDLVLSEKEALPFFREAVVVEEKLDGANVSVWPTESGALEVASRGGPGSMDRGDQLGRLRAWVAEHSHELLEALGTESSIYCEWLWRQHTIAYPRLPSLLFILDAWQPTSGFFPLRERNRLAASAGVPTPPLLFEGVIGNVEFLRRLIEQPSPLGAVRPEGVVVRRSRENGEPRLAKVLASAVEPSR